MLTLQEDKMVLSMSQPLSYSNTLTVSDGDEVVIKQYLMNEIISWLLIFLLPFSPTIFSNLLGHTDISFLNGLIYLFPVIVLLIIVNIRMFRLEFVKQIDQRH